jgi:hypothetical protein
MPEHRSTVRPRRGQRRGYTDRQVKTRELRQRFLIVCEGGKTEPRYFESFHLNRRVVPVDIRGLGADPLRLVRKAEQLRTEEEYTEEFDQVWVVFDCDDFAAGDINRAVQQARRSGIRVAYSNQAFELWYLLHFDYHNTAVPRCDYVGKLSALMGRPYAKNSATIYRELESRQPAALANARRLLAQYDPPNPAADDPSTTVHELVEQLNRFLV